MSRTDKDAPHWVRAEFYEPNHMNCPLIPAHEGSVWRRRTDVSSCTLSVEPVRLPPMARSWRLGRCTWDPVGWDRKYYTKTPKRVDRRVYFHGPNRRMIRDFCAKARQEYAGCGEVDSVEPYGLPCQLDWWD